MVRSWLLFVLGLVVVLESARANPFKRDPPPAQPDESDDDNQHAFLSKDFVQVGDMIINKKRLNSNGKVKREPFDDNDYHWPKSGDTVTIPYTSSGVDSNALQRAIEVFNAKTCIRFVPRGSQKNYVSFQSGSGCNAMVGYQQTGGQTCYLTTNCGQKKGKILHEMMHILSFLHEQCRSDRNSYITVNTANIKSGASSNFDIISGRNQGLAYDCDSILHYKGTAFSSNGQPTITSSHCSALGNGDTRLSLLDYKRVNTLYSCDSPTYVYFTVRVETHSSWTSGTDCFIYIKLHGSSRTSTEFELELDDAGSSNPFESGSDDTFSKMAFRNDLGTITGISIRMVSNGSGEGWWPTRFTVTDPVNNNAQTVFTNNAWRYPSSTYGTSEFPASSS